MSSLTIIFSKIRELQIYGLIENIQVQTAGRLRCGLYKTQILLSYWHH
jgi:hypothetical protein